MGVQLSKIKFSSESELLNQYFDVRQKSFLTHYNSNDYPNRIENFDHHQGALYFLLHDGGRFLSGVMLIQKYPEISQELPFSKKFGKISDILPNENLTQKRYAIAKGLVVAEGAPVGSGRKIQKEMLKYCKENLDILIANLDPMNVKIFQRSAKKLGFITKIREDLSFINPNDRKKRVFTINYLPQAIINKDQ